MEDMPDMFNQEIREQIISRHPIITKDYTILTPMIEGVYNIVRELVWMRKTGAYVCATPRYGKTRCANAVKEMLRAEFPKSYVLLLSADEDRRLSGAGIVRDLLMAQEIRLADRTSLPMLESHLLTEIRTQVAIRGGNQFVLIIDELQLLNENEFNKLLVLHNRLEQFHIAMSTIGFGQPEIQHRIAAFAATQAYQLIARFLNRPIPFFGCNTEECLKKLLKAYDDIKTFPEESEWTYTRFFLESAFNNGFRLANNSDRIWAAIKIIMTQFSQSSIPMDHATQIIEYLLVNGRNKDKRDYAIGHASSKSKCNSQ